MIRSFQDKEAEKIFHGERSLQLPQTIQKTAYRKLHMLHNARELRDLSVFRGNHFEKLAGDRKSQYSIWVNDQYRVCFEWRAGDAYNVEIVDYH
jgi:proteic killer suppression protein